MPNELMKTLTVGANTYDLPQKTSDLTNDSGFITSETDPTVPSWAKASSKPTYTASEVGAATSSHTHGNITNDGDITTNATIASGDRIVINDESASKITNSSVTFGSSTTQYLANNGTWQNIPTVPTKTSDLTNDSGFVTSESDPVFSASAAHGISSSDISAWNAKSDFSGSYNDLSDKPTIPNEVTESTVAGWGFTKNTGTYSKPSGGIPKTDLASAVQTSLDKADTALQSYTETDPVFTASAAHGITSTDITNWNNKQNTVSAGDGIDITTNIISNTQGIEYIVGTQTASTNAWTGVSTDSSLKTGKIIAYYLPYAGTSTAATLNLTMANGTTTGAIALRRQASSTVTTHFAAGNVIVLIYDGTYWKVSGYYFSDSNTVPTGYCTTAASTAAKSATCTYGYRDDTTYFPCVFRYANTAANATLAIASYATDAAPIYVNGARTSSSNTFGKGVILFLYHDGAYYCYNDGRLPILYNNTVTSVQDLIGLYTPTTSLASVATSGSYNDLSNKPTIPDAVTESTVASWGFTKNTGTYSKPDGGIPKTDLASAVQTSLGKADTALQSYTESDPIFTASAAHGITSTNITNWNNKISEPASEGTNGQVLMTNGSGTRTWGSVSTADEKIKLTSQSTSGNYPLIFGPTSITSNSTYQGYYNTGITINPNTKAVTATTFVGALTGTASGNLTSSSTLDASKLSGTIPSAVTATTQTSTDNSTKIATTAFVQTVIDNLPEPMVFKGSLGTGGTITSLPTASTSNTGYTYKVITAGTYASQSAKIGDTFISDGSAWILIPSGDEPSGTVTSITLEATSPISIDSNSAITTSGTRTLSHADSGVTAGTYKSVTVDSKGHVTAGSNPSETDPIFTGSAAYGISSSDITNWNNKGTYSKPSGGIPKTDLASAVQTSLGKADTALQSFTESDPTVPSWAKQVSKPTYTASEVGALPDSTVIPSKTSDLTNDSGFITSYTETDPVFTASAAYGISSSDISDWNGKADLDSNSKVEAEQTSSSIVSVTADRTLALTDAGKFLNVNSSSDLTITVPTNASVAFPTGTEIEFCRYNTGAVTFAGASGVTLLSIDSVLTISDRYGCVAIKKIDTDTWILSGALE